MQSEMPLRVAVVDDDPGACAGMARLLRAIGMQVDTYASGEDYLASPQLPTYDGLVLDVRMGGMSGLELQRQLCGRMPGLPVVFVTAHDDPGTRREAERQGCVAFFGKTESGNLVIDALRTAATRYRSVAGRTAAP